MARYRNEETYPSPLVAAYERFAKYYDAIYHDLVDYEGGCDFLESVFQKFASGRPSSILDMGCGTGSHALGLARRGFAVTGLDASRGQLREARIKARGTGLPVRFLHGDMARFDLGRTFDAAICMFGGFGYLLTDRAFASHFGSVRRHLDPGGVYVFEFWHRPGARDRYVSWVYKEKPLEIIRLDVSRVDARRSRMVMEMRFFVLDRNRVVDRFVEVHTVRLFTVPEMEALLARSRFRLLGAYAGTPQRQGFDRVRKETFRITAVAVPVRSGLPRPPSPGKRPNV